MLDDGEPKYLNSPETPVFSKGRELYGLFEARAALRASAAMRSSIEGYMDVVALAQPGFPNAVATLGTACTAEHVQKLFRFTDSVVFSFDGDAAGRRAAAPRARGAPALRHRHAHASASCSCRPSTTRTASCASAAREAFEQRVAAGRAAVAPDPRAGAAKAVDLATAEGRARFLANGRPLWSALPDGMLKRQLLGEIRVARRLAGRRARPLRGARTRPPVRRRAADAGRRRPRHSRPPRAARGRRCASRPTASPGCCCSKAAGGRPERPPTMQPCCALPGWHGELFRFLDREAAEHGAQPWAALRERLARRAAGRPTALAVVDAEDPADRARSPRTCRARSQPAPRCRPSGADADAQSLRPILTRYCRRRSRYN